MSSDLVPRTDLTGRVALVTGSSRGLGAATARRLAAMGADVVVTYRKEEAQAESVSAAVKAMGRWSAHRQVDMSEPESVEALFDWIGSADGPGGLDILVANAAATSLKPLLDQKVHNIRRTMDLCVTGFLVAVQRAVPLMEARGGGRIVAISGIDTVSWAPAHGLLAAAKAALESLVPYLTVELGGRGITAIGVNPGPFYGESLALMLGDLYEPMARALERTHPLRRACTPDDVAEVVALCCTDAATWLAGSTVMADGADTFSQRGVAMDLLARRLAAGTAGDDGGPPPGAGPSIPTF